MSSAVRLDAYLQFALVLVFIGSLVKRDKSDWCQQWYKIY